MRNERAKGIPNNDMPGSSMNDISISNVKRKEYPTLWMIQPVA